MMKEDKDLQLLSELMWKAEAYARRELKNFCAVKPMLFIHGIHGHSQFTSGYFRDVISKDDFVMKARVICIARRADATVLVSDARIRTAPKCGKKECAETKELVCLKGETRTTGVTKSWPLIWIYDRRIMGEATEFDFVPREQMGGRFGRLLSDDIPNNEQRREAKRALEEEWRPEEFRALGAVEGLWPAGSDAEKCFVISPDGIPITPAPFECEDKAEEFAREWCNGFREQGYYAAVGRRIPLDKLWHELTIVPESQVEEAMLEVIERNKHREEGKERGCRMVM